LTVKYGFIALKALLVVGFAIEPLFLKPDPVLDAGMPRPGSAPGSDPAPGSPEA
jgi:hypothetical protein